MMDNQVQSEVQCPCCGERIKAAAKKCKHCKTMLDPQLQDLQSLKLQKQNTFISNTASSGRAIGQENLFMQESVAADLREDDRISKFIKGVITIFLCVALFSLISMMVLGAVAHFGGSSDTAFLLYKIALVILVCLYGFYRYKNKIIPHAKRLLSSLSIKEKYRGLVAIAVITAVGVAIYGFNVIPATETYLGSLYYQGKYVTQDYAEAAKLFQNAADHSSAHAQYNLGILYVGGRGVAQDYREAAKWFAKSAEQGEARAQYNLGVLYEQGKGVTQDYYEAIKWYQRAADAGNADAKVNLAALQQSLKDAEAQREQDSSEEGESTALPQANDNSQVPCKPYTTPDGVQSGIACQQPDGTWRIKSSQNSR